MTLWKMTLNHQENVSEPNQRLCVNETEFHNTWNPDNVGFRSTSFILKLVKSMRFRKKRKFSSTIWIQIQEGGWQECFAISKKSALLISSYTDKSVLSIANFWPEEQSTNFKELWQTLFLGSLKVRNYPNKSTKYSFFDLLRNELRMVYSLMKR